MSLRAIVSLLLVVTLGPLAAGAARAEPPASAASPAPAATPAWTWRSTGSWGWIVLGSGVAIGALVTTYGLTFDCAEDRDCQRRASITIWTGAGLAALSSAIGLAVVQAGRVRVQVGPAAGAQGIALSGSF